MSHLKLKKKLSNFTISHNCCFFNLSLSRSPSKHEANITFTSNWDEILRGSLIPGEKVRIIFDAARLPGRDRRYGQKAWEISAEVKYNENGGVHSARLEGPDKKGMMITKLSIPSNATSPSGSNTGDTTAGSPGTAITAKTTSSPSARLSSPTPGMNTSRGVFTPAGDSKCCIIQ